MQELGVWVTTTGTSEAYLEVESNGDSVSATELPAWASGAIKGALTGAATGAAAGPWGAVIGAAAGGALGAASSAAAPAPVSAASNNSRCSIHASGRGDAADRPQPHPGHSGPATVRSGRATLGATHRGE